MIRRALPLVAVICLLAALAAKPAYCLGNSTIGRNAPAGIPAAEGGTKPEKTAAATVPTPEPGGHLALAVSPALTPGKRLYKEADQAAVDNPINWSVMVYKSRHELVVYFEGRFFKKYSAVFGRARTDGPKEWEDDRRTPQGVYKIIEKYPSQRFRWFLLLNYPNSVDRLRYRRLRIDHDVPRPDGHVLPIGGDVGIHGTNAPILNRSLINWTTGCISVSNRDISQLARLLPLDTIVIIYH